MRTAIILHGVCDEEEYFKMDFPSPSNAHWLPWLQQRFLRSGALCQTPEMPSPFAPIYEEWEETFFQIKIDKDTTVVAHSAGCGFILKWLHNHKDVAIEKLILVAPWLDPFRTKGAFLETNLEEALGQRIKNLHVLYSSDEKVEGVLESKNIILKTYPQVKLHLFENKGHFCLSNLGSDKFEDLWTICCE